MLKTNNTTSFRVLKYALPIHGHAVIEMPEGAEIISVRNQREQITLWATAKNERHSEKRDLYVAMTGEPVHFINAEPRFLDTVLLDGGNYVAHVFEILR